MKRTPIKMLKILLALAAAAGLGIGALGVASAATGAITATSDDDAGEQPDDDTPLTRDERARAEAAAIEYVGEGTVTESEVGDDGAAFSVEIRLDDGSQIEVGLDGDFNVVGSEPDDD